jgi:hypothetical protein
MKPELHKLLLELDNKDFYTDNYFSWTEEQKQTLTEDVVNYFFPLVQSGVLLDDYLLHGFFVSVEEAEEREDYEQAEILNRCLAELKKKIGIESIY